MMTDYEQVAAYNYDMWSEAEARADALAAEVERLTAELQNTTVDRDMALSYADVLKNERDALRAQLDAGEGWRPVSEAPEKKGYYLGWRGDRVVWAGYWPGEYYPDSSPWVDEVGLDIAITHWRPLPAPPQE